MKKLTFISIIYFALMSGRLFSQAIGIGESVFTPDPSAMLEVQATNKGILIPRVALTQTTLSSPITSPATSLLVYNTATINDVTPGYYYWDGTKWVRLVGGNGNITCNTANFVLKSNGTDVTCSQIFDDGTNVGIGTTSPNRAKLEIAGMVDNTNAILGSGNQGIGIINNWPGIGFNMYWSGGPKSISTGYTGSIWVSPTDGHFEMRLGQTNAGAPGTAVTENNVLTVLNNGNVGIGVTNPSFKLEIAAGNNTEFIRLNNSTTPPFDIYFGNNLGGVSNADGVVYFEIFGNEIYVMGGHVVPDGNLNRDLGSSPNHMWNNVYANDIYLNSTNTWLSSSNLSDKRFKKDIEPINSALSNVLKLKPVKYSWNTEEFPDKHFDNKRHIGLIAQEVEEVYPEIVNTNDEGFKSIDYSKLVPVLIKAVQEQQAEIEALKKEIKELKK